jgi:hypothetical protein
MRAAQRHVFRIRQHVRLAVRLVARRDDERGHDRGEPTRGFEQIVCAANVRFETRERIALRAADDRLRAEMQHRLGFMQIDRAHAVFDPRKIAAHDRT